MNLSERNAMFRPLSSMLMLGFKYLAWLNGLGLLLVLLCALGLIATDFSPEWLRFPLLAFSSGVLLCGLSLLWAYLAQVSLFTQFLAGYARRTHWVPLTCMIVAYCLSLVAFLVGCWLIVYLAGASYQASDDAAGPSSEAMPYSQSGDANNNFIYVGKERTVQFLAIR
ncbi:hypothetical protein [Eoetvoesiella caeni]|nr:hypothetical protein [Eoetvoesiella caeni]MCI2808471.1 hypothetical protein [Eoetvoesiella caeni]NYT55012.1 hypothetical protein [Eoetvoesiella caeni]